MSFEIQQPSFTSLTTISPHSGGHSFGQPNYLYNCATIRELYGPVIQANQTLQFSVGSTFVQLSIERSNSTAKLFSDGPWTTGARKFQVI